VTLAELIVSELRSLASRSLHALFWSYAGAVSRILAQLVIQVALARILGPGAFGQAAMVMVVLSFGWLLADSGFGSALIQKAELTDDDIAYALGWVTLLSLGIGGLVFACAPLLALMLGDTDTEFVPLMQACGCLVPLQAVSNIPMSLLRRNLDMKRQQILNVGGYVFGMGIVATAMALAGYGAWALVVGFGVQTFLNLAVGYLTVRFPLRLKLRGDRGLRNFGFSVMATNIANWAIDNLDRIAIGKLWGAGSLGEYSAAGNLARAPASILVGAAQSVVFSSASRVQDDAARVGRGFSAVACMVLLIAVPVFCFLSLHASLVVQVLYGERWRSAVPLFAALCIAIPSYAMLSIAGPTLWAVGAAKSEFKVQALIALLMVGGLWLLGAVGGVSLVHAVWLVPALYTLRSGLVVTALARRIDLAAIRALHTCLGGLVLAGFVVAISLGVNASSAQLRGTPMAEAVVAAVLGFISCLAVLRLTGRWLLVPDLCQMLLVRAGGSQIARHLCRLIGLQVPQS